MLPTHLISVTKLDGRRGGCTGITVSTCLCIQNLSKLFFWTTQPFVPNLVWWWVSVRQIVMWKQMGCYLQGPSEGIYNYAWELSVKMHISVAVKLTFCREKKLSAWKINCQYKKKEGSTSFGSAPNTRKWARFQSFSFKSIPMPEINQSMTVSSCFIYNQTWFVERSSQASRYPCSCCCFYWGLPHIYSCHGFAAERSVCFAEIYHTMYSCHCFAEVYHTMYSCLLFCREVYDTMYSCHCCRKVYYTMYTCHCFAAGRSSTQCIAVIALLQRGLLPHNIQLSWLCCTKVYHTMYSCHSFAEVYHTIYSFHCFAEIYHTIYSCHCFAEVYHCPHNV